MAAVAAALTLADARQMRFTTKDNKKIREPYRTIIEQKGYECQVQVWLGVFHFSAKIGQGVPRPPSDMQKFEMYLSE